MCRQRAAGKYNWDAVDGLDRIVGWCRAHGIKIIISFLDNWSPVDSKYGVGIFGQTDGLYQLVHLVKAM